MNHQLKTTGHIYLLTIILAGFTFCNKDQSSETTATTSSSVIAVAASESALSETGVATDSVYILQHCERGSRRDSIAKANMPAAVSSYLVTNYADYTFKKAFVIKNRPGETTGYVAVIFYNDKPIGIEFDSSGNFVRVLEQREKSDLEGKGWHPGGRFRDRDRLQKDTVALSSLPAGILSAITANYPQDTLLKAFKNRNDSYLILSHNNGLFATVFNANSNFVKRVQLHARTGKFQGIEQGALAANITTYLNTAFPNYVFKKAFSIIDQSGVKGYVVVIDANNTKYAVAFDASGNFLSIKTIC